MSTRDEIIKAATRIFAEKGYEGMTIKEITKEVGVTPPAVYAFFKSKEDVFLHIYKGVLSGHLQLATDHAESIKQQSVKEQLEQMLHSIIDFQLKEPLQMKIFIRLLLFPPEVFDTDLKENLIELEKLEHDMLCQIFKRGMETREIKDGDCSAISTTLLCIMDGLFWEMQRYDEESFRKRFDIIWGQFWQGIANKS